MKFICATLVYSLIPVLTLAGKKGDTIIVSGGGGLTGDSGGSGSGGGGSSGGSPVSK